MTEETVVDDLPEDAVSDAVVEQVDDRLDRKTVSKIVERERQKAYEKARREAMEEQQSQQQQVAPQLGGMQISPEQMQAQMQAMMAQQLPQHLEKHIQGIQTQHMVDSFATKMQAAEARHPGLSEKLGKLESYDGIAPIIQMANNLENTGDIMADLMSNPGKMGSVLSLFQGGLKNQAMQMMSELSNSIKTNVDAAAKEKQANDPMAQLKSSALTTGSDDKDMSVNDLRKMFSQRR